MCCVCSRVALVRNSKTNARKEIEDPTLSYTPVVSRNSCCPSFYFFSINQRSGRKKYICVRCCMQIPSLPMGELPYVGPCGNAIAKYVPRTNRFRACVKRKFE